MGGGQSWGELFAVSPACSLVSQSAPAFCLLPQSTQLWRERPSVPPEVCCNVIGKLLFFLLKLGSAASFPAVFEFSKGLVVPESAPQ